MRAQLPVLLLLCACGAGAVGPESKPGPSPLAAPVGSAACRSSPCPQIAQLAVGTDVGCARTAGGELLCWVGRDTLAAGLQDYDHVMGTTGDPSSPGDAAPALITNVVDVDLSRSGAGDNVNSHACALTDAGEVWCWGSNDEHQVNASAETNQPLPVKITGLPHIRSVRVGVEQSCAIDDDGGLWCWGSSCDGYSPGILFFSPMIHFASAAEPRREKLSAPVAQVSIGADSRCALLEDSTVWCRGVGYGGQLGDGDQKLCISQWQRVPDLERVVEIAGGSQHTCARLEDGSVRCWGQVSALGTWQDQEPKIGFGRNPVDVAALKGATSISSGADFTCGLMPDGSSQCVSPGAKPTPSVRQVTLPFTGAIELRIGLGQFCARLSTGAVQCITSSTDIPVDAPL